MIKEFILIDEERFFTEDVCVYSLMIKLMIWTKKYSSYIKVLRPEYRLRNPKLFISKMDMM